MFLGLGLGWQLEKVNRASTMRMRLLVWDFRGSGI